MGSKLVRAQYRSQLQVEPRPLSRVYGATNLSGFQVHSEWGSVQLVESLAGEWRELCQEGPCDEPFYRPEWISAAVTAFAGQQRLLLITVRKGSRLRAVLPLIEHRGRAAAVAGTCLRSASLIPRFDVIHGADDDLADSIENLWQHLRNVPGWGAIELVNIPQGGAAEALLAAAGRENFPTCCYEYARSPYIPLAEQQRDGDFSRFGRSSRFRYHLRQGWRELSKLGPLRIRRTQSVDPETLQFFYRLEHSGWKGKKGTAIACSPEMQSFYDRVVRGAEEHDYLSMYFLDLGDTTVAAHLAFTYGGRYFPIKVAYDEKFSHYGPGHLIIARVLEDCVQRGLTEFDCLGDWTDAKAKWTEKIRPHLFCGIFRGSLPGYVLRAKAQLTHDLNHAAYQYLRPVVHAARSYVARIKNRGAPPPRQASGKNPQAKP